PRLHHRPQRPPAARLIRPVAQDEILRPSRSILDPFFEMANLSGRKRVGAPRHFRLLARDHLQKIAVVGLAGNYRRPGLAAREHPLRGGQQQPSFSPGPAGGVDAMTLKDWCDMVAEMALVGRCRRSRHDPQNQHLCMHRSDQIARPAIIKTRTGFAAGHPCRWLPNPAAKSAHHAGPAAKPAKSLPPTAALANTRFDWSPRAVVAGKRWRKGRHRPPW